MFKPNNKKILAVLITLAMVFSALAVISMAAQPAYAQTASGTFYANVEPVSLLTASGGTVLTPLASPAPMIFVSTVSGSFTAGQTVDFYWSTTAAASGIVGGVAGTTTASSSGTISGGFRLTSVPSTPGSYYLVAASEGVLSGGVASSTATLTVTAQTNYPISLQLSSNGKVSYSTNVTSTVSSTIYFEGSGFESTTAITVAVSTISGASITTLTTTPTTITPSSGKISGSFTVPSDPAGYYYVIAYDGGSGGGLATAQSILNIKPSVSPVFSIPEGSVSFTVPSTETPLVGSGFPSTATFAPSTVTSPSNTLTIGGVDAILSATSVFSPSPTGAVSFIITGLASPITTTGPQTVVITDQQGQSFSFPDQAYVSSPTAVPTLVLTDEVTGTNSGYVGDSLLVTGFNLPASSTTFTVYIGGATLATGTTDSNGFISTTATVPTVPGGTYTVYASVGYEYVSTTFTIMPSISIKDSSGSPLSGEWAVAKSAVTISATGLAPLTEYAITDTGLATLGYSTNIAYDYSVNSVPTITAGASSIASNEMGFLTDGTGSLTVTYDLAYKAATGTTETITFAPGTPNAASASYLAVGPVTISGIASSYAPSTSSGVTVITFTASGLVPAGQFYTPETSLAYTGKYYVYFTSGSPVKLSTGKTYFTTTTTTASVTFNLPTSVSAGPNTMYVGSTDTGTLAIAILLVSSAGTGASISPTSTISTAYPGEPLTYYLYDFPASTAVTVKYYNNIGAHTTSITTDANGAANFTFTVPNAVAGTYQLFFTYGKTTVTGTYIIPAAVSFDQTPYADTGYSVTGTTDYKTYFGVNAYPGENVTFYAYSLDPNTLYLYGLSTSSSSWSGIIPSTEASFTTDQYGDGPSTGLSMMLPVEPAGTYYILFAPYSTLTPISEYLTVELGGYSVLYSNLNYSDNMAPAFPGQLVNFVIPASTAPPPSVSYFEVNILLNGTSYETVKAYYSQTLGGIAGSFKIFNGNPGNWYYVSLAYAPVTVTSATVDSVSAASVNPTPGAGTISGNTVAGTTSTTSPTTVTGEATYTLPAPSLPSFINAVTAITTETSLVATTLLTSTLSSLAPTSASVTSWSYVLTGNYAIATIDWSVTYPVTSSAASFTLTIQFDVAYDIATSSTVSTQIIGSFTPVPSTSSLEAKLVLVQGKDAIITGITSGQIAEIVANVTSAVKTSMQVPLSELNASVVAINGAVAKIDTAFGNMTATLKAINASLMSVSGNVATVDTTLGKVQTSLASLNASLMSVSGNVAIINTTLGKVQMSLASLNVSIAAVNAGIVTLKTSVGTLQTSINNLAPVIKDINGTVMTIGTTVGNINMNLTEFRNMIVKAISNGTATVIASINGMNVTMQSSLSAINAKLVALNGSVATISTTLGTVQTSLSSIGTTVSSTATSVSGLVGSVATIQTSVGTISGTVTSISGSVATIQTSIGTLQTSVSAISLNTSKVSSLSSALSTSEVFEIVILVLVLITLVLSFLAISSVSRVAKKVEEQKKQ